MSSIFNRLVEGLVGYPNAFEAQQSVVKNIEITQQNDNPVKSIEDLKQRVLVPAVFNEHEESVTIHSAITMKPSLEILKTRELWKSVTSKCSYLKNFSGFAGVAIGALGAWKLKTEKSPYKIVAALVSLIVCSVFFFKARSTQKLAKKHLDTTRTSIAFNLAKKPDRIADFRKKITDGGLNSWNDHLSILPSDIKDPIKLFNKSEISVLVEEWSNHINGLELLEKELNKFPEKLKETVVRQMADERLQYLLKNWIHDVKNGKGEVEFGKLIEKHDLFLSIFNKLSLFNSIFMAVEVLNKLKGSLKNSDECLKRYNSNINEFESLFSKVIKPEHKFYKYFWSQFRMVQEKKFQVLDDWHYLSLYYMCERVVSVVPNGNVTPESLHNIAKGRYYEIMMGLLFIEFFNTVCVAEKETDPKEYLDWIRSRIEKMPKDPVSQVHKQFLLACLSEIK